MSQDPAFLFYPGDYLRDTQVLSESAQVAYDRIMCEHMRNICSDMSNITVSQSRVDFITKRLSEEDREQIMSVLTESKGEFQIYWVAESISKRKAYSESRSRNRSSKKTKNISSTYDQHMENENVNENKDEIETRKRIVKERDSRDAKLRETAFEVFDFWNDHRGNCPRAGKLTDSRISAINARIKEYDLETVKQVIRKVSESSHLQGGNDRTWTASLDWLMKPTNFLKTLEGNYDVRTIQLSTDNNTNKQKSFFEKGLERVRGYHDASASNNE